MFENADLFSRSLCSLDTIKFDVIIESLCTPPQKKIFSFELQNSRVHFNELENSIFHLSAARREKCRKNSVFWSGKIEFGQGKVREFCR